jgi:hypothetical protein
MADPDGKGWVMLFSRYGGGTPRVKVGRPPGLFRWALFTRQVSNESLILAQNQRWRRA